MVTLDAGGDPGQGCRGAGIEQVIRAELHGPTFGLVYPRDVAMESRMVRVCDACGIEVDGDARRVWWNSVFYDADLCPEHSASLVELMDAIASKARRLGALSPAKEADAPSPSQRAPRSRTAKPRVTTSEVRAWAIAKGIDVNPKGRVPESLLARYVAERGA